MNLTDISYLDDAVCYDFTVLSKYFYKKNTKNNVHYYLFNYDSSYKELSQKTQYFTLLKQKEEENKTMIICGDCKGMKKLNLHSDLRTYGLERKNDVQAVNLLRSGNSYSFDLYIHKQLYCHINQMGLPIYEGLAYITYLYLTDQNIKEELKKLSEIEM